MKKIFKFEAAENRHGKLTENEEKNYNWLWLLLFALFLALVLVIFGSCI